MTAQPLRKRIRVRPLLLILLCGWLFALHVAILLGHGQGELSGTVGDALLAQAPEMASANAVTTVVVSYRGFDTLGEVTVLFLAATGIALFFGADRGSPPPRAPRHPPNEIMVTGIRLLFPVLVLFGVYIVVHGHLSPGGGFQGGVVIATAFFLRMLADPEFLLDHGRVRLLESLSGSGFVLFGLAGLTLVATATFLGNFLPHPVAAMGRLLSAGVIPLIYCLVGIKVGAEVGAIFQDMVEQELTPKQEPKQET
ncbi:multisubunit Na+/H+ antiporter, MnhB subunit [Thioflavicoccus mobilis 8321]|uniref:Multisubunit Na+/H+ antiporter, MnhB subunit n=1 Tax=Thioflavicoccus mobilis 8321 TaxID=765912 RepID=L0GYU7_9GAMM|nr:hydrogen gas-evolving membrane-bound hydrogenase subunit E [Thioflavicoccus mobilis]AGA91141.1 multisubunit Na+/H+ antiporter, MnhB subunit [Thioflavicoccus mobilis 8321]